MTPNPVAPTHDNMEAPLFRFQTLLQSLERCSEESIEALQSRNVVALETVTREHTCLQQKVSAAVQQVLSERLLQRPLPARATSEFEPEACCVAIAKRILHLGKLQCFLIARMKRRLRFLSAAACGPQLSYGPPDACPGSIENGL